MGDDEATAGAAPDELTAAESAGAVGHATEGTESGLIRADMIEPGPAAGHAFVSLQPLTMDLLARQLEHVDIQFERDADRISASWDDFTLIFRIVNLSTLYVSAVLRTAFPAKHLPALVAVCNDWNSSKYFMTAHATVFVGTETQHSDETRNQAALARLVLDYSAEFEGGVAPVQLQAILRRLPGRVTEFLRSSATRTADGQPPAP